jgi:hypothetical protein
VIGWLLDAYRDRRTYGTAVYLLLGLPLGIFEFVLVVTGLSFGLGLFVTLLGIPVLVATLLLVRALAAFERRLAWSLLEAPMPWRGVPADEADGVFWTRLRALVAGERTWRELAFLLVRLPLGIVDFVVLTTIVGLALGGFAQPVTVLAGAESELGEWTVDTFAESLVFLPVSLVFLLVGARLVLGWGAVPRFVASSLLGRVEPRELKRAVLRTLTRTGEADGFRLLDELELQLGRGPFLTPTKVEAALLALESTGRVTAHRNGGRVTYTAAAVL